MQRIDHSLVRNWGNVQNNKAALAISIFCPHCGERCTFTPSKWTSDSHRNSIAATCDCPSCAKYCHFWMINNRDGDYPESELPLIYLFPPSKQEIYLQTGGTEHIPQPIVRALKSTIEAFNTKNYPATAVCARRTLEGIFKYLLPEEKRGQTLAKLIESAKTTQDLAAPLTVLSHAIRDGGNLGAHFDMENEPTEEMSRQMVNLLQYLISYLYTLPKEIQKLEESLSASSL